MAGANLLALLDDIATLLDDVAVMAKVATKKTVGLLGDDLAVNAEQVSGVRANRELPVVWAVAKGSAKNKLILVPAALIISVVANWVITPILMLGGVYLCFEGFEKIVDKLFHDDGAKHQEKLKAMADPAVDLIVFERQKIKGAIRTDFILSAEIIVIALGTVQDATLLAQVLVVSGIAAIMTVGVYSAVACIVKLDDAGLYLMQNKKPGVVGQCKYRVGFALLSVAPKLMKALMVVGTAAMFLVGGGILVHGFPQAHGLISHLSELMQAAPYVGHILVASAPVLANVVVGMVAGALALVMVTIVQKLALIVKI